MASTPRGISEHSTRPSRKERREQNAGLSAMIAATPPGTAESATPPAPQQKDTPSLDQRHAQLGSTEIEPAGAPRLAAADAARKTHKTPFSTQIDTNTDKRLSWLIRRKGWKKTDITSDALDALFDRLGVPPADQITD